VAAGQRAARAVAAIDRALVDAADDRSWRVRALGAVERFVPCDAYAFVMTDPVTMVGCSPVASVPDLTTLPDLIRLKYLTPVHRWTALPDTGCATLRAATGGRLEQSRLWREHLARFGVTDVLSCVFTDRFGCWGFLDLWRTRGHFTAADVATLADVRPAVTAGLRRLQAAALDQPGHPQGQDRPGALILTEHLRVRAQTPVTSDWLAALVPPEPGRQAVPAAAYNVAAQLLAREAGVDQHPARTRVHLGGGTWLSLRADRLCGGTSVAHQDIAVTMEACSPPERRELFCRAHGLTPREAEALRHIADGADTRGVARAMGISELTVQDHLKSAFTKTGTSSRRQLLARSHGA
jgi:DNA-binding CsgD family transcriptional regulator